MPLPRNDITWDEIDDFPEESFREVARLFGTAVAFKDWLDALKKLEDTRKQRLSNEQIEGRLIEREFVQTHVFGVLRGLTRRLLRDAPKTLAKEIYAMAKAGRPVEDAEKALREGLGSQVLGAKARVSRALGGQGPKSEGDDDDG